jgi:hypothetical protein
MLVFRSEDRVGKWYRDWRFERGAILGLGQCWQLAEAWYSADRRDPLWRRRTPQETQELFTQLGLIGPFWQLR